METESVRQGIAVIGLGYVVLPLTVAFARGWPVVGFDINIRWIAEVATGRDRNGLVPAEFLRQPCRRFNGDPEAMDVSDAPRPWTMPNARTCIP